MTRSTQSQWLFLVSTLLIVFLAVTLRMPSNAASVSAPCQTPYFKRVNGLYLGSAGGPVSNELVRKAHMTDLNNDGKTDMAVLRLGNPKTLIVLMGQGNGSFLAPVSYPVGDANSTPSDVKSGDFNGDGKRDLIVFSAGASSPPFFNCASSMSVLFGDGVGSFATPFTYGVQLCNYEVSVADFNNDGKSDVVLGSLPSTSPSTSRLFVGLGDGTGTFGGSTFYDADGIPAAWTVGDFNGDNKPDIAVGTYNANFGDPKTKIMLNDGTGNLLPAVTVATIFGSLTSGDLNLDGKTDLVVSNASNGTISVLSGNGMGGITGQLTIAVPSIDSEQIAIGDFNGDSKPDIASQGTILQGDGLGGFTFPNTFPRGGLLYFESGDLNGDGRTDLAVYTINTNLTNTLGFTISLSVCSLVKDTSRIDYDGDGKTDLAVWRPSTGQWVIRNSAGGTQTIAWGLGSLNDHPVPGDYDGDGKSDLAVFRDNDSNWYILNSSNNTVRAEHWGTSGDKPVAGDYDGDGKSDIAVFRPSTGGWYVLRSSDNSLYGVAWGTNGDKAVPEDYDGDDKVDVAVFRPSTGYWYIYRSSDNGYNFLSWGLSTDTPMQGDYDGDGKADLMVYRASQGVFWLRRSFDGSSLALLAQSFSTFNQPISGDFDGDGTTDPTVRRTSDNLWMFRNSFSGMANTVWGTAGDLQTSSAYPIE